MKFMKLGTKADTFYTEQATRYFILCSNLFGKKIYIQLFYKLRCILIMQDSDIRDSCRPCDTNQWYYLFVTQGIGLWMKMLWCLWKDKSKFNHWFIYNSALFSCSFRFFQNVASYKGFAMTQVIPRVSL